MKVVEVEFYDPREIEAGTIAATEMHELCQKSKHGEIVLVITDGRVIESHCKVSKRYGKRGDPPT